MFDALRLLVLSFLYYFGFTYASFIAIKQHATAVVAPARPLGLPTTESVARPQSKVLLGPPALKLMIMLTSMSLLSLVGAEWFPLFSEMRLIFMYTLLFAPPYTQQELYDQIFGPLLFRCGTFLLSLQTSDFISRKASLLLVRSCVNISVAAMNYTQRSRSLEEDAVRDILSGLRFTQRALQQVADMTRESEGATYSQIARDNSFPGGVVTSHVRRAPVAERQRDHLRHRTPLGGEGVQKKPSSPQSPLPMVTESLSSTFTLSHTGSDVPLESLHSEYTQVASDSRDSGRSKSVRDDRRSYMRLLGIF